jgi:hypothetical protein
MATTPKTNLGKIEFYESHLLPWTTNMAAVGLAAPAIAGLDSLTSAARDAYDAHVSALAASRAATQAYYEAVRAMHSGPGAGADMIATIRNHAQTTDDPNVYNLAQIPPPATPGVTPPPGVPSDFRVELLQNGALALRWKCKNPVGVGGTIYEVLRSVGGGAFSFVGNPGEKTFTDETVPQGSTSVTYQITATRSTARGNPAQFTVTFGAGGQSVTVQNVTGGGVKLAA